MTVILIVLLIVIAAIIIFKVMDSLGDKQRQEIGLPKSSDDNPKQEEQKQEQEQTVISQESLAVEEPKLAEASAMSVQVAPEPKIKKPRKPYTKKSPIKTQAKRPPRKSKGA